MSTPTTFDPLAPLGPRTLIEASAGTGKTYALASLAVRLLADGEVEVEQLLVVTFGRLAADELRDRIRKRMQDVLERSASSGTIDDPLAAAIAGGADAPDRRARLQQALDHIDGIAVSTIHAFAQQAIATLGSSAGVDPDLALVGTDPREGPTSGADALAVASMEVQQRRRAGEPVAALPSAGTVTQVVKKLADMPDLELRPDGIDVDLADDVQVQAGVARHAVELARQRRRRAGVRNFSELLTDLRDALRGPQGKRAAAAIRARFSVALIDEFQDTDRVQWEIFDTLFGRDGARMVLVGDPKQAIYRFRGADVATYVHVAEGDIDRTALSTNWRSDAALVDALAVLFDGATFGDDIAFQPVHAAPEHADSRLRRDDGTRVPALSIRLAVDDELFPKGDDGLPERLKSKPHARKAIDEATATSAIVDDVVAQAVDLLEHGRIADEDGDRPFAPRDLAVLTRTRSDGARIHRALRRAGVPAVLRADDPLLASSAATEWRILLAAIGRPSDPRRARAAALGVFGDADPLGPVEDSALESFQERLGDWGATLARRGVAELLSQVRRDASYAARALADADGDRLLTDLDHIGELLVVQIPPGPATVPVLEACLATDPDDDDAEADSIATRRVDSDDDAVQVMTIHKSKGLEFGAVFVVGIHKRKRDPEVLFHDPDTGRRVLDLARDDPATKDLAVREQQGDASRLLYVALTRAKHATAVWWSHEGNAKHSALTRLLFGRDPATGAIDPERYDVGEIKLPEPDDALALAERLAARCPTGIEVAVVGASGAPRWSGGRHAAAGGGALAPSRLDRAVASGRRRWSYTSITAQRSDHEATHDGIRGGHDEGPDEGLDPFTAADQTDRADAVRGVLDDATVSKLVTLPAGAAFGTLVHGVLERVDFSAEDLGTHLGREIGRELDVRRLDLTPVGVDGPDVPSGVELLRDGLTGVVTSPLGPAFDDRSLKQLGPRDRLNELDFDLHLGGDGGKVRGVDLGRTVLEHLADDDPFRGWAEQLAAGRFAVDLAGSLNGSIDLVARVGEPAHPRFVVVDYKTNRLHDAGAAPGPDDYDASSMVDAMIDHDYPLQALLYAVALHRFLRWRLPDYRPDEHLGGAAYLFVRGMAGPETRVRDAGPDGVCRWAIPPALVGALSDRLAGR